MFTDSSSCPKIIDENHYRTQGIWLVVNNGSTLSHTWRTVTTQRYRLTDLTYAAADSIAQNKLDGYTNAAVVRQNNAGAYMVRVEHDTFGEWQIDTFGI